MQVLNITNFYDKFMELGARNMIINPSYYRMSFFGDKFTNKHYYGISELTEIVIHIERKIRNDKVETTFFYKKGSQVLKQVTTYYELSKFKDELSSKIKSIAKN